MSQSSTRRQAADTFQKENNSAEEEFFTPSFASEKEPEQSVFSAVSSPSVQPEKKRFVPPVFEEKERPQSDMPKDAAKEPVKEPVKEVKNRFQQKILEAQKAQAESQQREFIPPKEKIVPVDAVNIIHAPLDVVPDDVPIDYSDEEERFAISQNMDASFVHNLFDEHAIPEEEKEALDWQAFLAYCEEHNFPVEYMTRLQGIKGFLTKENCYIKISNFQAETFNKVKNQLENLLCTFLGRTVKIQVTIVAYELVSDEKLREKASNNPQIQTLMKEFGAEIYRCYDIKHDRKN